MKVSAGLASPEAYLLGLQMVVFSLGLHNHFLCVCVCVLASSFHKDTNHMGLQPIHIISFYLNDLFKGPASKDSPVLRSQERQHTNLGETRFSP